MTDTQPYDLAFVGHYTRDTIVYPHSTRTQDGGGYYFGAVVAARMGLAVAVVTRLAEEDWEAVRKLERLGVRMLARPVPSSTVLRLTYPTSNLDQRIIELSSWAGPFEAEDLAGVNARAFAVAASSIRGEISPELVGSLASRSTMVALDVQGFIRVEDGGVLGHDNWPEKEEVLRHVSILKTDSVEAELLTGEKNMAEAARRLSEYGPREVLVTHSGGVLLWHDGVVDEAPFVPRELKGRSGRGDTCTGAYVARRLSASPRDALFWTAAVTSLKLEEEGPFNRDISEAEALYERLRGGEGR